MKKYLTLAAAVVSTVAVTSAATAAFEVGVGVSKIHFGGDTKQNGSTATTKRNVGTSDFAFDGGVAYGFDFGKWSLAPMVFIQSGTGDVRVNTAAAGNVGIHRKHAYGAAIRGGFEVAPQSHVYVKLGVKKGKFRYTSQAQAAKTTNKAGLLGGVGFAFGVSEKIVLDLGYSYVNYGKVKSNPLTAGGTDYYSTKLSESDVRLGVTYKF